MATITWNGGSGDWNTAGDWSSDSIPAAADTVLITAAGTYTLTTEARQYSAMVLGTTYTYYTADIVTSVTLDAAAATLAVEPAPPDTADYTLSFGDAGVSDNLAITAGTLQVTAGADYTVGQALTLDAGRIDIAGELDIGGVPFLGGSPTATFGSTGTTTVEAGGLLLLEVDVTVTTAQLGTLTGAGTLQVNGTLDNTGATFAVGAGSIATLDLDGTVIGGTLDNAGGSIVYDDTTLDAVTFVGTLDLSTGNVTLTVTDGLTLHAGTGGSSVILMTGTGSNTLALVGDTRLDNGTLELGSRAFGAQNTLTGSGEIVIGPDFLVDSNGGGVIKPANILLNQGSIVVNQVGTSLSGDTITVYGTFINDGTVTIGSHAVLDIAGYVSAELIGSVEVATGGVLEISGTLDATGDGVVLGDGSALGDAQFSGVILNGTFAPTGSYTLESRVTLEGVTWQGTLNGYNIDVLNGLTLLGSGGTGAGAAKIFNQLRFDDSETVDNATVTLSNGTIDALSDKILTFAAALVVEGSGAVGNEDETIDNAGTIIALAGGDLRIDPDAFTNTGTLEMQSGSTLDIEFGPYTLAQLGSIVSNAGTIRLGSSLHLTGETLDATAGNVFAHLILSAGVTGGTIVQGGGTMNYLNAGLNAVTVLGTLDLSGSGAGINVTNGLTLAALGGGLPGAVALTGANAALNFDDTDLLDNAVVTFGAGAELNEQFGGDTLTLGPNLVIEANGSLGDGELAGAGTIVNQGTITIGTGGFIDVDNGGFVNSGSIEMASGSQLFLDTAMTTGQIGTVENNGGTLQLGTTLTNTGATLDVTGTGGLGDFELLIRSQVTGGSVRMDGGTVTFDGGYLDGVTWLGSLDLGGDGDVDIVGGLTVESATAHLPGTIVDDGTLFGGSYFGVNDSETLDNAVIVLGGNGVSDELDAVDTLTLATSVTVDSAGANLDALLDGDAVVNHGQIIAAAPGGDFNVTLSQGLTNDGTLLAGNGDTLSLTAALTTGVDLTGTVVVTGGATVQFHAGVDAGQTIAFADAGTVSIDDAADFLGTITGFVAGDTIDLTGLTYAAGDTAEVQSGHLVVTNASDAVLASLAIAGETYPAGAFQVGPDGIAITTDYSPPCFAAGTKLATPSGDIAVEQLRPGMPLRLARGGIATVRWIGHRHVRCDRHPRPAEVWPVLIDAGAFGEGLPRQALWLSPDHAVAWRGVLIPVRYLLNGATVRQVPREAVHYFHLELASHDIVLAEGLPVESYLDTGNRAAFANGGATTVLHADFARRVWKTSACAPLVTSGPLLRQARAAVLEHLPRLGYIITDDPALRLLDDDGRALASQVHGDRIRLALPDRCSTLRLVSRRAAPAELDPAGTDWRRLGVPVAEIVLDEAPVPLDDPRLQRGWHGTERGLRWTDGAAALAVAGARVAELRLASVALRYCAPITGTQRDTSRWRA